MGHDTLPDTFSYRQARTAGLSSRRIYALRDAGVIEQIGRGLYRKADAPIVDLDLTEAVTRAPQATLCLLSALAHHELTDTIPDAYHLALPRGTRHPAVSGVVRWHSFAPDTFRIGRHRMTVGTGVTLFGYDAPRTIVDVFRMRGTLGSDVAYEALRRWLRHGGRPAALLAVARSFPAAQPALRHALEVLL